VAADALREATLRFYDAVAGGDADAIADLVAEEAVVIGTDDVWLRGRDAILDAYRGLELEVEPGEIETLVHGDIGWTTEAPTITAGGQRLHLRRTAVWRRDDGAWRIMQSHASIAQR
jgi:ketosteroid isomerase-like protein